MFPNYDELYDKVIKTYPYLKDVFSDTNAMAFPIGDSIVFFLHGVNDPFPPPIDKIKLAWVITSLLTIPFYSANLINEIDKKNRELAKANETITRMKEREKKVEAINAQQKLIGEQLHDIKNMLSPVRGRFELIKKLSENIIWKEGTSETQKRIYKNSIDEGTESAKNLYDYLDGLGDFLNINEGHKKDVELSELLKKLEDDYLPLFNEKKINLVFNVKDKALVCVDPNILYRKVFMNLIQNILEHSRATEASVTLELREEVDNKYAVVIFSDNGIGMSKETLDEIVVLQRSTKATAYEGSRLRGLGFPSALKATSLYNGYVDVFSEFGKGSKFEVYLPLKKDKNDG